MLRDQIKLSQLRALIAVAESGNFGEAGLQLGVSQSAVSHAIASLEAEMGIVLFARGRHGAHLTPVGERMVKHAQAMMGLLDEMEREANIAKGLKGGDVRISVFRSVATHVLPEVIARFHERFPNINFSITEYQGDDLCEGALRRGQADIGFTCLPPNDDFEAWELFRDEYVILFPPNAKIPPDPITWDVLHQFPLILPYETDYCFTLIRQHFERVNQPLRAAYQIKEDSTIVGMVMRGLGATVIARLAAAPLPPEIQVRRLPVPLERTICAIVRQDALLPPAVYAFLDALRSADYPGRSPSKLPQAS